LAITVYTYIHYKQTGIPFESIQCIHKSTYKYIHTLRSCTYILTYIHTSTNIHTYIQSIDAPAIPCSHSGVLNTLCFPNSSCSPTVHLNTPPKPTSSPNTMQVGSESHTYIHAYIHTYIHIYKSHYILHTYIHTFLEIMFIIHWHTYILTYTHSYIHIHTYRLQI